MTTKAVSGLHYLNVHRGGLGRENHSKKKEVQTSLEKRRDEKKRKKGGVGEGELAHRGERKQQSSPSTHLTGYDKQGGEVLAWDKKHP